VTSAAPIARVGHAGAVCDGKFFIHGGRTAYDAEKTLDDLWSFTPNADGKVLLITSSSTALSSFTFVLRSFRLIIMHSHPPYHNTLAFTIVIPLIAHIPR
jgi:hypothetical protein